MCVYKSYAIVFIKKRRREADQNPGNYKPFFTSLNVIQLRLRWRVIFQRRSFRSSCWLGWGSELWRRLRGSGRLLFYSGLDLTATLCSETRTRDIQQGCATVFSFFSILVLMHDVWLPFEHCFIKLNSEWQVSICKTCSQQQICILHPYKIDFQTQMFFSVAKLTSWRTMKALI